jgi:hypothetical protein
MSWLSMMQCNGSAASRASRTVLTLMRLGLASCLFAALTRTVADADLWGHLAFGREILHLRAIPSHDSYSFTSTIPWINHEWLAEIISYASYAAGGIAALVAVKSILLLAMLAMVLVALHRVSSDVVVHDLLVFLVVAGTYGRSITFRPQVFSLVLFPALLLALLAAERGRARALAAVPVIFLLWANLHGGWIVGLAAFGIWGAWAYVHSVEYRIARLWLALIGAASLAATLVNPYGLALWDFLASTVRVSRGIADWQPLWKLPFFLLTPWLTATALAAIAIIFERRRVNPSHVAIVAMCWIGSVRVSRLDAFFILSTIMLLGPQIQAAFRRFARPAPAPVQTQSGGVGSIALGAMAVGLIGMVLSRGNFTCVQIQDGFLPEPEAVLSAKLNRLQGRMLTFFDWGEYAIWHLGPDVKVSMDGRRETVYSEDVIDKHFALYQNKPGALDFVEQLQPDYIWLPAHFEVVNTLRALGWNPMFAGPKSVILTRKAGAVTVSPAEPVTMQPRCFPGP